MIRPDNKQPTNGGVLSSGTQAEVEGNKADGRFWLRLTNRKKGKAAALPLF